MKNRALNPLVGPFGRRITQLRELKGLAKNGVNGVSQSYMLKIENQGLIPSNKMIAILAKSFAPNPSAVEELTAELRQLAENPLIEQRKVPFLAPPRSLHPLAGRSSLFHELTQAVFSGGPTALRGIPGVGKTALALSLVYDRRVAAQFPDGILWCGLGPGGDAFAELGRWGLSVGLSSQDIARSDTVESRCKLVHAAIGMRRILLVADDVWDDQTAVAFRIGGPHCAQIITTRSLRVAKTFAGPRYFEVGELPQESAAELLARFVPELLKMEPAKTNAIIEAVGGLPMAIILIGGYLRSRAPAGPKQLRAGIDHVLQSRVRLALSQQQRPTDKYPGLPGRAQLSLGAVIGISYDALSPQQRSAMHGLAIFPPKPNSFSESAALAVAATSLQCLAGLVDSSLIETDEIHRCRVHQTIFDYLGARRFRHSAQSRFVSYYGEFLRKRRISYKEIDIEFSNIQASLKLAVEKRLYKEYLSQIVRICPYLDSRGFYLIAENLLRSASTLSAARNNPKIRAELLLRLGQTLHRRGQLKPSESALIQATELDVGNASLRSMIFDELGYVQEKLGKYETAEANFQQSLKLARKSKNQRCLAMALSHSGWVALSRGAYDQAKRRLESALNVSVTKRNPEILTGVLIHLGWALIKLGRFVDAESVLKEGYAAAESINFRERMAAARLNQGVAAEKMGDYDRAELFAREALEIAEKIGNPEKISAALTNLGLAGEYRSQYEIAEGHYSMALEIARELKHPERISNVLQNLGSVSEYRGHFAKALAFNTEALGLARQIGHQERLCSLLEERGSIELKMGDLESARQSLEEGLQIARKLPHIERQCAILRHQAELALFRGDSDTAQKLIDESSELVSQVPHEWQKSSSHMVRGEVLLRRGKTVEATHSFLCALRISRAIRSQAAVAEALFGLSRCRANMGANTVAQLEARASVRLFSAIGNYRARAASDWLRSLEHLPRED